MKRAAKGKPAGKAGKAAKPPVVADVPELLRTSLRMLEEKSTKKDRDNLARFGIAADQAVWRVDVEHSGDSPRVLGRNHELAEALWETGWYEARMLAIARGRACASHGGADGPLVPRLRQLGHLRHRLLPPVRPHAARLGQGQQWAGSREEFVKRAAFALLASLAVHDKTVRRRAVPGGLPLIERAASDERNFVKKGVSWALRVTGRRSHALNKATIAVSRRLAESPGPSERWIGKGALRELTSPVVARALARK